MTEFSWSLVMIGAYRIIALLSGVLSIYLGYKLFRVGIYEKAGDLKAVWGTHHLALKQAAPGTFFALFGAVVISVGIWKGVAIQSRESTVPGEQRSSSNPNQLAVPSQHSGGTSSSETDQSKSQTQNPTPAAATPSSDLSVFLGTTQVENILDKAVAGKPLTDDERKKLENWRLQQKLFEKSWGVQANRPPDLTKNETTG